MALTFFFALIGYLCGSILFARTAAWLFHKDAILSSSADGNPGTTNAFLYGGIGCGLVTLLGDLFKGFLPVFLFMRCVPNPSSAALALVLAAPVLGHAYPLYYHLRGGKGIAVTFGCLLGLLPTWRPLAVFAAFFLFFSLIVKVTPHFQRTWVTYLAVLIYLAVAFGFSGITLGFLLITCIVFSRLHLSKETREAMEVKLLWMH